MNTIEHDESMKDLPMLDHTAMVMGRSSDASTGICQKKVCYRDAFASNTRLLSVQCTQLSNIKKRCKGGRLKRFTVWKRAYYFLQCRDLYKSEGQCQCQTIPKIDLAKLVYNIFEGRGWLYDPTSKEGKGILHTHLSILTYVLQPCDLRNYYRRTER